MRTFNINNLKRNPDKIKSSLKKVGDSYIATKNLTIIFPERYIEKGLAFLGSSVNVVGIFIIIDDNNNYSIMNMPNMVKLQPNMTDDIEINDKKHIAMYFDNGDVVIENVNVVKKKAIIYDLFDEFLVHGNIPWYMDSNDVFNILSLSDKYTGSDIGNDPLGMELLTSIITRTQDDKTVLYRKLAKNPEKMKKSKPVFIGILNIYYTFSSTISKISGSYLKEGITAAVVNKEESSTKIEDMITR